MAGDELNIYELRVLRMAGGIDEWEPWGAWISACLEFLKGKGYVVYQNGSHIHVTEKGRQCLEKYS